MNEKELQRFEEDLARLAPARPPEDFMARLSARIAHRPARSADSQSAVSRLSNLQALRYSLMRWFVPAAALGAAILVVVWLVPRQTGGLRSSGSAASTPELKADDVQIDHELVSTFDAVAQLPSGEPVRFRCHQWMDQVVLSDNSRGVTIAQRTPRVEIVPVGFDTY